MPTPASQLPAVLAHNQRFVREHLYEPFLTDRFPDKKLAIVTCMDTRLVELLPRAMGVRNGDVKIVKTAGAVVSHPFGSIMRSLLVAVYELGAREIMIVGHYDCGMAALSAESLLAKARQRGIAARTFDTLHAAGIDLEQWLAGVPDLSAAVRASVQRVRTHPLLPADVLVHGLMIDPATGHLDVLDAGEL